MDSETARTLRKLNTRQSRTAAGANKSTPSGTAFPTGIAAGFLFFRTDVNWLMVYDGTEWITAHELVAPITFSEDATTVYAATTNAIRRGILRNAHQVLLVRGEVSLRLAAGTSNATNFWTLDVVLVNLGTTVWTFDTKADSAAAVTLHATTTFTQPASATDIINLNLTKTLAPPNISILAASLFYRIILP